MIIKSFPQSVGDRWSHKIDQAETQGSRGIKQKNGTRTECRREGKRHKHETYLHAQIQPAEYKRCRKTTMRDIFFAKVRCSRTKFWPASLDDGGQTYRYSTITTRKIRNYTTTDYSAWPFPFLNFVFPSLTTIDRSLANQSFHVS